MLPLLAEAVQSRDVARIVAAAARYGPVFDRLDRAMSEARELAVGLLGAGPAPSAGAGH